MADSQSDKTRLLLRSLAIAGGLTAFKVAVFFLTNSVAILASAADSLMDLLVSLANFALIRTAARPADHNHPYGHGKIESMGGMIQSLVIGGVAVGLAAMSVRRFLNPEPIEDPGLGMLITLIALALNIWHARNLRSSMVASGSQVMATEYLHYASDTLVYLGVLLSFVLFKLTGGLFWDPLISLLIVAYLLTSVASIFRGTLDELLDVRLSDDLLKEIDAVIRAFDSRITEYTDLRTRKVGPTKFIDFRIKLRDVESFREAHFLITKLAGALRAKFPGAVVTIHADPAE